MKKILLLLILLLNFALVFGQDGNKSIHLDNSDYRVDGRYVDCGSVNYNSITGTTANKLTIMVWIKETRIQTNNAHENEGSWANIVTLASHKAVNTGQFWVQHSNTNSKFEFALSSTSRQYILSTTVPEINRWYFITAVYDGSSNPSMKLYVNGNLENSTNSNSGNITAFLNEFKLNIGRIPASYRFFSGYLDDLRIYWNKALTQDEIRAQMHSVNTIITDNLVSYYKFNSTSGVTVTDEMNNANGTYYAGLVDVHGNVTGGNVGYNRTTYEIADADKVWAVNGWVNDLLVPVGGKGFGNCTEVTIASNTKDVITLSSWMNNNTAYDPEIDGWPNNPSVYTYNISWYGIKDVNSISQWNVSHAPVCQNYNYVTTTTPTTAGPNGGNITVTLPETGTGKGVSIYQWGETSGAPVTSGETFPGLINKRSNVVWGIQKWGSFGSNVNFVINYSAIGGVTNNVKLLRRKRDSSVWIDYSSIPSLSPNASSVVINTTEKTITLSLANADIDSSQFALGEQDGVLPVNLQFLNVTCTQNIAELNWATLSESNNRGFEIYRKASASDEWIKVGYLEGAGNSTSVKKYSYKDVINKTGLYKYRIVQYDFNGNSNVYYSANDITVTAPNKYKVSDAYPNPFNPTSKINVTIPDEGYLKILIYNTAGQEIKTILNGKIQSGYHTFEINLNELSSGIYFARILFEGFSGKKSEIKKLSLIK